jgi:hypothetical protein
MVVVTESFHNCNQISVQCNLENLVSNSEATVKMDSGTMCSVDSNSDENIFPILRSVPMSASTAISVHEEMQHFLHVDSSQSSRLPAVSATDTTYPEEIKPHLPAEFNLPNIYGAGSAVSYILPSVEDSIVSAIVLSKWDDVMGPQTVHVWLRDDVDMKSQDIGSTLNHSVMRNMYLRKSVKYVTSHTVNYTGLNSVLLPSSGNVPVDAGESNSGIFIVPELDLVAQSLVFQLQNHEFNVPYSLAMMVSYQHYDYFLHLHQLCRHWLQRTAARLRVILLKVIVESVSPLDACVCAKHLYQGFLAGE